MLNLISKNFMVKNMCMLKLTKIISLDTFCRLAWTNLEWRIVNLLHATNTSVKTDSDTKSQNPSVTKIIENILL